MGGSWRGGGVWVRLLRAIALGAVAALILLGLFLAPDLVYVLPWWIRRFPIECTAAALLTGYSRGLGSQQVPARKNTLDRSVGLGAGSRRGRFLEATGALACRRIRGALDSLADYVAAALSELAMVP